MSTTKPLPQGGLIHGPSFPHVPTPKILNARRLTLATLASLCALALCLGATTGPAWAAGGSFQFGPLGEEAGQIDYGAAGMAVDSTSGDIYVSDTNNNRIDKFDSSGKFLMAWGWGVATGANEFQTCTTSCRRGQESGEGAGAFCLQNGVAVDQSNGDVYVDDFCNYRVQEFDSSGKFLLMFGGHVNKNGTNVCVAGEECLRGTEGTGDGEFNEVYEKAYIAVGPGGDVYVGDKARVEIFEPSGAWKENISLSALSSEGKVTGLAVNSLGDVFVKDEGVPGVREFEPPLYLESPTKFDEGSETVDSIALDSSGDLYISENRAKYSEPCACDFKEFSPSGQQLEIFGGHTLISVTGALAYDEALKELLTYGTDQETTEDGHDGVWAFTVPSPGPLAEPGSEQATPELRGAATLQATVNPEGETSEVKFEYVDEANFKASGYASATSTAPESISSSFEDQHVVVHLPQKALVPGLTYHWRVVGKNSQGTNAGPDDSFEEIPAAEIEGPWAARVTATSATLSARINPLGASTSFRLEYGTGVPYDHVLTGSVGEGMGSVLIEHHIQELAPSTTYHYRIVTESEVGNVEGADRTFTTQLASAELALPDGRSWELVSPPDKGGALIENIEHVQAASDGSGIVYAASEAIGEGIVGHVGNNAEAIAGATLLSRREAGGWRTHDISPTQTLTPEGQSALALFGAAEAFMTFTPNLSLGVLEPRFGLGHTQQSPEATEPTLYLRNDIDETYAPLVSAADVPPGTKWDPGGYASTWENMSFQASTPDLSHILFSDWAPLTPEAVTEHGAGDEEKSNLYEWSSGHLQLVNIVPNQATKREEAEVGASFGTGFEGGGAYPNPWAMSSDGRWIVFRYGQLGVGTWYVRDMVEHKTVPFGRPNGKSVFETMSRDGSRLFYLEKQGGEQEGELYVFDPATGATTNLTADHLDGELSAGVQNPVIGISEDGSYVYFVAKGVLASGASQGQDNLYVMHYDGSEWQTTFIATLSSEDQPDWTYSRSSEVRNITSRVTLNGGYLAFMSERSLTGYDNRDARSGQPDEEVYLYDAATNHLVCASCNPTGARPIGVFDHQGGELLMDQSGAWVPEGGEGRHWLAATIAPDWHTNWYAAFHQTDYLSNDGRLFFNSSDALVPQDTNGLADVYEYEPPGVGSCTSVSPTFSEAEGGCVNLISSGQSSAESTFLDASESGNDAFFITAAKLVVADYDTAQDVYDAHVCTEAVPCRAEPVSSPECTSGDSCKAAPSPQPTLFGPPPSQTFNGAGNVVPQPKVVTNTTPKSCAKGKVRKRGKCVKKAAVHKKRKRGSKRAAAKSRGRGK